jgi:hypothetical protein
MKITQNIFSHIGSTSNYKALKLIAMPLCFVKNMANAEVYAIAGAYHEKLPIVYANIRV